jgi:hypothetical protein
MKSVARYAAQVLLYVAFGAALGYFSSYPVYEVMPADQALVRLSLTHGAKPIAPCRERTDAELAKLPPNMRVSLDCPRERAPVKVEIEMDDKLLYEIVARPAGIRRDGPSTVYRRLQVPAGRHEFKVRLSDTPDGKFGYRAEEVVELPPGRVLLIDFNAGKGGFLFRR